MHKYDAHGASDATRHEHVHVYQGKNGTESLIPSPQQERVRQLRTGRYCGKQPSDPGAANGRPSVSRMNERVTFGQYLTCASEELLRSSWHFAVSHDQSINHLIKSGGHLATSRAPLQPAN